MNLAKTTKKLVYTAVSIAIMILLSQLSIPMGAIPFSLGLLGIFLISGILGGTYGTIAVGIYVIMGACGLPVFAGFKGGLGALLGATGGFIMGYLFVPIILGVICTIFKYKYVPMTFAYILSLFVCYLFGALWYMNYVTCSLKTALMACVVPFIAFDLLKIVIAELLVVRLRKLLRIHDIMHIDFNKIFKTRRNVSVDNVKNDNMM